MKTLFYILIFFLSNNGFGQEWLEDTLELKGNVKSVHYTRTAFVTENEEDWWTLDNFYHYNEKGFLVKSEISGYADDEFEYGKFRIYNNLGDKCMSEYDIREGDTTSKLVFIYNSHDKVIKSNYYTNNRLWNSAYYKYNELDLIIEKLAITQRNDSLWDKYEYDEQNRMIKYIDSSKSLCVIKTWKFDSKNRLVEFTSEKLKAPKPIVVQMGNNGQVLSEKKVDQLPKDENHSILTYQYNAKNQIIKESRKFIDSDEGTELTYEYNQEGDVASIFRKDIKTGNENTTIILYTYDKIGNWITKSHYWNDELDEKETREIEYY